MMACVCGVDAKLGEAPFECDARYGSPERVFETLGMKGRLYNFNNYRVIVEFENNFSVLECITPKDAREEMSEAEVRALMEAVSGTTNWGEFLTPKLFNKVALAKAERLQADWSWKPLGPHMLIIAKQSALEAGQKRRDAEDKAKAAGFGGPVPEPVQVSPASVAPSVEIPNKPEVYINVDPRPLSPQQMKIESNRVAWLRSEATNGVASAQYDLGMRYLSGKGVGKDQALAREWLEKAAAKGHTYAKRALGGLPK